ncbi:MAG TPA: oligopeptide:H+ symporter, partial [Saprospiraceae bacterium]|nr:oligopeptide:H+ symporter [Saprospiraceae bacterium]
MLLGLVVFWNNIPKDKGNAPDPVAAAKAVFMGLNRFWVIVAASLAFIPVFALLIGAEKVTNWILIIAGLGVIGYLIFSALSSEDKKEGQRLLVFIVLFFFHMIFWTLFEQAGGSLNILTDRYVNKMGIETSQFQSVNPLFIILLAPVFTWIWTQLGKRKQEPRTPMKFVFALLQMALGYFIIVIGAKSVLGDVDNGGMIPLYFLLFMYLFHTTGELSLSPVGLSVVTKLSPAKTVGFVMGSWFLSIAFAHKIGGYLGQLIATPQEGASKASELTAFINVYMNWGVYLVLGCALLLLLLTPVLKKWMHGVH